LCYVLGEGEDLLNREWLVPAANHGDGCIVCRICYRFHEEKSVESHLFRRKVFRFLLPIITC